ncbi:MAG: hypothetical protein P8Y47_04895, partial [Alphaproteobacteria bacterium]
ALACMDFSNDDRAQFAQLIGYSLNGAADLGYMPREILIAAEEMYYFGESELGARNAALRETLMELRDMVNKLFEIVE